MPDPCLDTCADQDSCKTNGCYCKIIKHDKILPCNISTMSQESSDNED